MKALMLLGALAASAVQACPGLEVENAWIRSPAPGADALAGYASLRNSGRTAITIDAFTGADFSAVMLHRTSMENGMARMRPVEPLTLAPGQSVTLAPGALHLMLMQPARALHAGERSVLSLHCGAAHRAFPFIVKDAE